MKIGLFDSGIGGITLLHRAVKSLPKEEYIFYADTDHAPYGTKKKDDIIKYSDAAVDFLTGHGCDIIVIACNTATSVAADMLRSKYDIPILGIEPAVKPAVEHGSGKRVLVIATPLTIKEKKLHKLVDRVDENHLVDLKALPELVIFAERGEFNSGNVKEYLYRELSGFQPERYECVVLGCTHFNHFKDSLAEIFGEKCTIIDGSVGTVKNLAATVKRLNLPTAGHLHIDYYTSGRPVEDEGTLRFYKTLFDRLEEMGF